MMTFRASTVGSIGPTMKLIKVFLICLLPRGGYRED